MEQIIPPGACLSCQGCCRFASSQGSWVAKLLPAEQRQLGHAHNSVPLIHEAAQGLWFCAYLRRTDNTCRVYERRPLECRLYPFVLNRHADGCVYLAYDPNCPCAREQTSSPAWQDYALRLAAALRAPGLRSQLEQAEYLLNAYEGAVDCAYLFGGPRQPQA